MQTIILDGKEYVLVPREQLREVPQPTQTTLPQATQSSLDDFVIDTGTEIVPPPVEDGLATNREKQEAIRVVQQQDIVTSSFLSAPPARSRPYEYRQKFLNKELSPADVMTFSRLSPSFISGNPEDPFIKSDAKKPESKRVFYGPGSEQE